jgi:hypothetical protein
MQMLVGVLLIAITKNRINSKGYLKYKDSGINDVPTGPLEMPSPSLHCQLEDTSIGFDSFERRKTGSAFPVRPISF